MKGTVKTWSYDNGYGFIKTNESKRDIFCHSRDIKNCYDIDRGDMVEFELEQTERGLRAVNVRIVYN